MSSPISAQCCIQIKTSQLISVATELTGFYMKTTIDWYGLTSSVEAIDNER